jgi:hypothetical protein
MDESERIKHPAMAMFHWEMSRAGVIKFGGAPFSDKPH